MLTKSTEDFLLKLNTVSEGVHFDNQKVNCPDMGTVKTNFMILYILTKPIN